MALLTLDETVKIIDLGEPEVKLLAAIGVIRHAKDRRGIVRYEVDLDKALERKHDRRT